MLTVAALEQRRNASVQSARIRTSRARIKARLAEAGSRASAWEQVADLIERPPIAIRTMTVYDLIRSASWTGDAAATWLCAFAGIGAKRVVSDMAFRTRERQLIVFALRQGSIGRVRLWVLLRTRDA